MKIAIGLEYPLSLRGGVSVLVEELIQGLAPHFEMMLVSPDTPESLARSIVAPLVKEHIFWDPQKVSRATSRELAKRIASSGARLAHFHFGGNYGWGSRILGQSPIPLLACRGVAVFSTVHCAVGLLDGYCDPQKPLWLKLTLLPPAWVGKVNVLRHVSREIAVSQHDAHLLRSWYPQMREKFLHIYHSRLGPSAPPPEPAARERFILNVGHIARRKGQLVLAEAFAQIAARHPDWKLYLAGHYGDPEQERLLKELAQRHGITGQLVLLGRRDDALDWMRRAAIFVQPSFFEGLPLALQEAMYSGCACIGTHISGNNEIITHEENGLLTRPGDSSDLARALERLMGDADLRARYSQAGPASIQNKGMTAERMVQRHIKLYESILSAR